MWFTVSLFTLSCLCAELGCWEDVQQPGHHSDAGSETSLSVLRRSHEVPQNGNNGDHCGQNSQSWSEIFTTQRHVTYVCWPRNDLRTDIKFICLFGGFFCVCVFLPGASVGRGGRALQHRGHRLPVGHPPGSGAQPCRYRSSASLASTHPLSWTLSSLPNLPSNPVPGRKHTYFTPGWLLPVAGCKVAWCLLVLLDAAVLCGLLCQDEERVIPSLLLPLHWSIFDVHLSGGRKLVNCICIC